MKSKSLVMRLLLALLLVFLLAQFGVVGAEEPGPNDPPPEDAAPPPDTSSVSATSTSSTSSPGVSPKTVTGTLLPGQSMSVNKDVVTPAIVPKPDIYFLADTTGSMGSQIANVRANAGAVLSQIASVQPSAQFGAGNYKDFPRDAYAYQNNAVIGGAAPTLAAINSWSASGGYDGSEGQFYALELIAGNAPVWRSGSSRIVVWFGDAPAHDPVCSAISPLSYNITEAWVTASLVAANIRVIAISTPTYYYTNALDDNPTANAYDYGPYCSIGGSSGQATRITTATGGVHMTGVPASQVSAAILAGLGNLPATVTPQLDPSCSTELTYSFSPASSTVTSGGTASFVETIAAKPTATGGTKTCKIHWLINGVSGGADFDQDIALYVPFPPVADANGPYSGLEGSPISLDGTGSYDPESDPLTYAWSVDSSLCSFDDASSATPNLTCSDNGSFTATLTVHDGFYTDSSTAVVTVANVAPSVSIDSVVPDLVAVGEAVTAAGSFTDPGSNDTHTAVWDWGDGTSAGAVSGFSVGPDTHVYSAAGVYTLGLAVTDDDGGVGSALYQYVIVYDPSAGFVTGGGWIHSPAGAYNPDPTLEGKANFGFVSKYKKGASVPTGNTEFQFHAGDLNFHSDSYDWLVVTGRNYAMFKGVGTINGMGQYKFRIWAGDDSPDTFRIKIWTEDSFGVETVVYDNGSDQPINSGSIVIHAK